jgi:hypothetical protein
MWAEVCDVMVLCMSCWSMLRRMTSAELVMLLGVFLRPCWCAVSSGSTKEANRQRSVR